MTQTTRQPDNADHQHLIEIARRMAEKLPDMRQKARDTANLILKRHTGHFGEPDHIWWHRWDSANSTPRSFTGWEHWGKPLESMTFPQLVMARFRPSDQDNADLLHQMGGFYTQGPNERVYNEKNEVRLDPQDVLNDFWGLNFASDFADETSSFWANHREDFRIMAKANFISKALEDREARRISDRQFKLLLKAVAGDVPFPISLRTLQKHVPSSTTLKVYPFAVGGCVSTDILRIVDQDGWQYLYMPGAVNTFHAFETEQDLYWWVMLETDMAQNRAHFMSHWSVADNAGNALHDKLDQLFYNWGRDTSKLIDPKLQPLSQDPFAFLASRAEQRMYADMQLLGHTNDELRKQLWVGYLQAFGKTFGGMAAVDWPVTLAVVGAGIAELGLHIDEAINGHTTAQRKEAVIAAIISAVDVLFNATFFWAGAEEGVGAEFHVPQTRLTLEEVQSYLPAPLASLETNELLAPLETNEVLDSIVTGKVGKMRGVKLTNAGHPHIEIEGIAYQVGWVSDQNHWAIVDPANPFSFYGSVPVRLNADEVWEPVSRAGLKGGGKFFGKMPWGSPVAGPSRAITPTFRYDVPVTLRDALRGAANGLEPDLVSGNRIDMAAFKPGYHDVYADFRTLRDTLKTDADAFFQEHTLPARPELPILGPQDTQKSVVQAIFAKSEGLVVGEAHSSVASKKILIDNMELLAKLKVRTLYLEHLLTDFHQIHLDTFARTGKMPPELELYLSDMDRGFHTDPQGRYTFTELVKSANRQHIRVQALDCMASYRQSGIHAPTNTVRQKMMNFFGHTVIASDTGIRGKARWVALVGNTHANTFNGVPGVAELEGAIGVRVGDVSAGTDHGFRPDVGETLPGAMTGDAGFVKSDLHYSLPTLHVARDLEKDLPRPGMFTLDHMHGEKVLVHRAGDGALVYTPIRKDGNFIYIERPKWATVHKRRFDNTRELITALGLIHLKHVG
ncbi:membrane-targeted effector domain-containing toxin [Pseudomonas putida]